MTDAVFFFLCQLCHSTVWICFWVKIGGVAKTICSSACSVYLAVALPIRQELRTIRINESQNAAIIGHRFLYANSFQLSEYFLIIRHIISMETGKPRGINAWCAAQRLDFQTRIIVGKSMM